MDVDELEDEQYEDTAEVPPSSSLPGSPTVDDMLASADADAEEEAEEDGEEGEEAAEEEEEGEEAAEEEEEEEAEEEDPLASTYDPALKPTYSLAPILKKYVFSPSTIVLCTDCGCSKGELLYMPNKLRPLQFTEGILKEKGYQLHYSYVLPSLYTEKQI